MGLFGFLKTKKKSDIDKLMEKVHNDIFPDGFKQIERETDELFQLLNGRYSKEQLKSTLLYASALFLITDNKSAERITSSIIIRSNRAIDEEDANTIYNYITKKFIKQQLHVDDKVAELYSDIGFGGNRGYDADEIPGGFGEFGLEVTNPVPVKGIISNEIYLGKLRTLGGERITWDRLGSTSIANIQDMIDIYEIKSISGNDLGTIYICPYHQKTSNKAPIGFKLI